MDNRVKTRADVRRVTGLPLLATLGDLRRQTPASRDQSAFRAWTALQSRLRSSPHRGMVCGITSANAGDGRSTWVDLLARAACQSGFRVLAITAQSSTAQGAGAGFARRPRSRPTLPDEVTLANGVLAAPARIAGKTDRHGLPFAHQHPARRLGVGSAGPQAVAVGARALERDRARGHLRRAALRPPPPRRCCWPKTSRTFCGSSTPIARTRLKPRWSWITFVSRAAISSAPC